MGELSEMAQIRNLHWTVEYGLIGTLITLKFMVLVYYLPLAKAHGV
jgi:hypothetical protein